MGTKKDIETAVFFDDDKRYADLLNGYIFDGKQVIAEKQLYSQDTRETGKTHKGNQIIGRKKNIQRFRDGAKEWLLELHLRSLPWNIRIRSTEGYRCE